MKNARQESFWDKVDQTGDCWLWTAYVMPNGYGQFWDGERLKLPHRVAYELVVGPIPDGLTLDHRRTCPKCCVNPDHLRPATQKQNNENLVGARTNSKSGIRGVYWDEARSRWGTHVQHNGRSLYIGRFDTIEEAEAAVVAKRRDLFTHNDADRA
jgi:hypothetical protein